MKKDTSQTQDGAEDQTAVVDEPATSQLSTDWETKYLRAAADYHNLEQRVSRQIHDAQERGIERIVLKLIQVLDDLNQAEKFVTDPGLVLVKNKFEQLLHEEGVEEIDLLNKPFDPELAECIQMADGPPGIVTEVHQSGYRLHGHLVRAAKVSVGKA